MELAATDALIAEPPMNVAGMAALVRELLAGGEARRRDARWLRERALSLGLDTHEHAALETLRARLQADTASVLAAVRDARW